MRLVVDGMNVIGSRPDGWWRDRAAARRGLVAHLVKLVEAGDEVTVVFDGRPGPGEAEEASETGVEAVYAGNSPNAADRRIVELVEEAGPETLKVVTSDAALRRELLGLGVAVEPSGAFRGRLGY